MSSWRYFRVGASLLVSVGALLMAGCGAGAGGSAGLPAGSVSGTGIIRGRAVYVRPGSSTPLPLAHAVVSVRNRATGKTVAGPTTADAAGNFEIDNVPAGAEEVVVEGTDSSGANVTGVSNVDVIQGSNNQTQVEVKEGGQSGANTSQYLAGANNPLEATGETNSPENTKGDAREGVETQSGAQSGGNTQSGAQSGGNTQSGAQSGGNTQSGNQTSPDTGATP